MRSRLAELQEAGPVGHDPDFDNKVVSAVGEAFNNVAIHGYGDSPAGALELEIEMDPERITIRLRDTGTRFDMSAVAPPDLSALPEAHLGLYIIQSFMDEVDYRPGTLPEEPNTLTMRKRY